ncbi:MAG: TIGR02391 family protein [Coleofasciculus sp. G1-WW12-02]|uniref:TIGR02391 family protein n=1 Tax=Coleofasciculus sp. G1-WW12-02 TaxID=3068483 RepID=UPI0032F7052C
MYNLTNSQKDILQQLVQKFPEGHIPKEFFIYKTQGGNIIKLEDESGDNELKITQLDQEALKNEGLLLCTGQRCILTGKAYEAVDTNFNAPDTSFVKHLTPLADITNLDEDLKRRCLPTLGAGSADPNTSWDTAVNNACRVLENRLRHVGGISDTNCVGVPLVNEVFRKNGTLASKFSVDAERQGYRDLYAGIFGAFRNPSAHHFVDPTPEKGGAFIVFVNLLLKKLEDLR